jgi:hypothetical protein
VNKRRWVDGPAWKWLCRVLGHQKERWWWYGYCSNVPDWHRNGLGSAKGSLCCRCEEVIE